MSETNKFIYIIEYHPANSDDKQYINVRYVFSKEDELTTTNNIMCASIFSSIDIAFNYVVDICQRYKHLKTTDFLVKQYEEIF